MTTLRVLLVLIIGVVAVLGLPQYHRHHGHDRHYPEFDDHHDHHHDRHHDHHHDRHHGHHHSGHHGRYHDHYDGRFRRAASPDALNGLRKARRYNEGFDPDFDGGFDSPYDSFGEYKNGNYQGYNQGQKNPAYGQNRRKDTGSAHSTASAQSISTQFGIQTFANAEANSGFDDHGRKR